MTAVLLSTVALLASQDYLGLEDAMVLGPQSGIVIGGTRQVVPETLTGDRQIYLSPYSPYVVYSPAFEIDEPGKVLPTEQPDESDQWYRAVDLKSGQSWKIARLSDDPRFIWAPNGKVLYAFTVEQSAQLRSSRVSVTRHDLRRRTASDVPTPPMLERGARMFLYSGFTGNSPSFPVRVQTTAQLDGPSWIAVPSLDDGLVWIQWTADHEAFNGEWVRDKRGYFTCFPYGKSESITVDPVSRSLVTAPMEEFEPLKDSRFDDFSVVSVVGKLESYGKSKAVVPLWLTAGEEDSGERALVAPEASSFQVAPDWTWLAYTSRGGIYVRNLQVVERDFVLGTREAIERTKALVKVKQIGTALQIYAADFDGETPPADTFRSALEPYIRLAEIMDGFVYTFNGQNLDTLENPSNTEVGYIPVKGGRAVVFADGHAKIVPNPG